MFVIMLHFLSTLQVLSDTQVRLWWSSRLVAQGSLGTSSDGLHASHVAVKYDTQVSILWKKLHIFRLVFYTVPDFALPIIQSFPPLIGFSCSCTDYLILTHSDESVR